MRFKSMLSALALVAFGFASNQALASQVDARWQYVEGNDMCSPDTMAQMLPFVTNDNLTKEVDDIKIMTYVLNILPFGGLWGPLVTLPEGHPEMPDDMSMSYLPSYIVGYLTSWAVIGIVGAWYIAPTAALNSWDRAYKCGGKKAAPAAMNSHANMPVRQVGFAF